MNVWGFGWLIVLPQLIKNPKCQKENYKKAVDNIVNVSTSDASPNSHVYMLFLSYIHFHVPEKMFFQYQQNVVYPRLWLPNGEKLGRGRKGESKNLNYLI